MKTSLYFLILTSVTLFSCKKEDENTSSNNKTNVVPFTQSAAAPVSTEANTNSSSAYVENNEKKESVMYQYKYTMVENSTNTPTTTVSTPNGMNPPHGQPKHRCDIPVGAPLNSPKANTATPPKSTSVVSTPVINNTGNNNTSVPPLLATSAETTPTPEGMNPPHGQPKHRCDIAVGAPLPKE